MFFQTRSVNLSVFFFFIGLLRKTALMLALCRVLRDKYSLAAVSIIFITRRKIVSFGLSAEDM